MRKLLSIMGAFLSLCYFLNIPTAYAQELEFPSFSTTVKLDIRSDDEIVKGQIQSYFARELRSISDVGIVDKDAKYEIKVFEMESELTSGQTVGYIISMVILQPFDRQTLHTVLFNKIDSDSWKNVEFLTNNLYSYRQNYLYTISKDRLKNACEVLVAQFDSDFLEQDRKIYQMIVETYKERLKKEGK